MRENETTFALVTGASSGIGAALCRLLASKGINLLITGRHAESLHELVEELQKKVKVVPFVADLTSSESRKSVIEKIYEYVPELVINNAGFGLYGDPLTYETKSQLEILEVNGTALLELTIEAARALVSVDKRGVILNVSSAAGELVFPGMSVYAASKAFVTKLSRALDYEFSPRGVRVLVSCPGVVDTAFRTRASSHHAQGDGGMNVEFAAKQIWQQIESGQSRHLFNWKTRMGIFLTKFIPQRILSRLFASRIRTYHLPRPLITQRHKHRN